MAPPWSTAMEPVAVRQKAIHRRGQLKTGALRVETVSATRWYLRAPVSRLRQTALPPRQSLHRHARAALYEATAARKNTDDLKEVASEGGTLGENIVERIIFDRSLRYFAVASRSPGDLSCTLEWLAPSNAVVELLHHRFAVRLSSSPPCFDSGDGSVLAKCSPTWRPSATSRPRLSHAIT